MSTVFALDFGAAIEEAKRDTSRASAQSQKTRRCLTECPVNIGDSAAWDGRRGHGEARPDRLLEEACRRLGLSV